jgi:hypothetical protein
LAAARVLLGDGAPTGPLAALHAVGSKVEQAYHHSEFEKRRWLMDAWA